MGLFESDDGVGEIAAGSAIDLAGREVRAVEQRFDLDQKAVLSCWIQRPRKFARFDFPGVGISGGACG